MIHAAGHDLLRIIRQLEFINRGDARTVHGLGVFVRPTVVFSVQFVEIGVGSPAGQGGIGVPIDTAGGTAHPLRGPFFDVEVGEVGLDVQTSKTF